MSGSDYDKGFGGSDRPPRSSGRTAGHIAASPPSSAKQSTRHGAPDPARPFGERAPGTNAARRADPTKQPWSRFSGRVAGGAAGFGLAVGVLALVASGNWAAPIVLPVLLGLVAFILFWVAARVLDTFRGL